MTAVAASPRSSNEVLTSAFSKASPEERAVLAEFIVAKADLSEVSERLSRAQADVQREERNANKAAERFAKARLAMNALLEASK